LGLKVPILKNVLKEGQGIKTGDLFPVIEDLDKIQRYMYKEIGIGKLIDLEKFVNTEFAQNAFKDSTISRRPSILRESEATIYELLIRGVEKEVKTSKAMLSVEGKYLTFSLGSGVFGIDLMRIREIIGMRPIRSMPQTPGYFKGVIDLRGKVIPIVDLRLKFGMPEQEYNERTCIIILELGHGGDGLVGVVVDVVLEVLDVKASQIEETPYFGPSTDARFILAMANIQGSVKTLLNIDHVISREEVSFKT
jgi:chemotaxis signal transduction protein